jgi:hypothetical protein
MLPRHTTRLAILFHALQALQVRMHMHVPARRPYTHDGGVGIPGPTREFQCNDIGKERVFHVTITSTRAAPCQGQSLSYVLTMRSTVPGLLRTDSCGRPDFTSLLLCTVRTVAGDDAAKPYAQ